MDVRRLLIFRTTAREGSIAAAARALGWTQPAVSQHLRQLEREAGLPLLVRMARGVRLTDAGHTLLAHADALAERLQDAEEELAALAELRAGTVRVAAFPSASAMLVPGALATMTAKYPGVDVQLHEAEPPEALEQLQSGEVDLALVFTYPEAEPLAGAELTTHLVGADPMRVVVPIDHPLARCGMVELAALHDERWVAGCAHCSAHLRRVCADAGFTPDVRHTTEGYVVPQALVAEKLAVTLLPRLALESYRHPGVAVVDCGPGESRQLELVHHREATRAPAVAEAVAALTTSATSRLVS